MKALRIAVVLFGLADLALTLGYYFQQPWATATWPWPMTPLGFVLVSSFLAGATVVILWLGFTGEWGAATGATANVGLMNAGAAVYLFYCWQRDHDPGLRNPAIAFSIFALANLGVLVWSLRHPIRDRRPVDRLLRVSFGVFSVVLLYAAVQLLRRSPTIFPWPLDPDTSTMFGWLFLGSAIYFIYGSLRPSWHNMRGQLLAFLAYDIVLIPPYLQLFSTVKPDHVFSLRVYMAVLCYSALLSIWYLFLDKKTRNWRIQS
jgi:hypothetical protein